MSALRRDLIERRLWLVVVLLIAGIAAVPTLLLKGGSPSGTSLPLPPPAPAATPTTTSTPAAHGTTVRVKARVSTAVHDPFGGASSTSSTGPGGSSPSASSASTKPVVSSPTTPASTPAVAMVTPTPTNSSTVPTSSSHPSSPSSSAPTTTSAGNAPHVSSTPVSTTANVDPVPAAKPQSWTMYSTSIRIGKDTSAPLRSDVTRLTPLPSIRKPLVMFMGVMSGGRQALFTLQPGIGHTGPGLCRPSHTRCAAIVLGSGQTEVLTVPGTGGKARHVILRVVRISGHVTHSLVTALGAYKRFSGVGLCEVALADPVLYDVFNGTVATVASRACKGHPNAVPFPSPSAPAPAVSAGSAAASSSPSTKSGS